LIHCPLAGLTVVDASVTLPRGGVVDEVVVGALLSAGASIEIVVARARRAGVD